MILSSCTDQEFRCLLDLFMCSDPYPVTVVVPKTDPHLGGPMSRQPDLEHQSVIELMLDREAITRGFNGWVEAYHNFKPADTNAR